MNKTALLLVGLVFVSMFSGVFAANTCSDGTSYGKCNPTSYYYCWHGEGTSIQLVFYPTMCVKQLGGTGCPAGYDATPDGTNCIKTGCDVPGSTQLVLKGQCSTTNKPYYCSNDGVLVQNPTLCGCPAADQEAVNDACVKKSGCAYSNPPCGADYNCDTPKNQCVLKSGCTYNNPACDSLSENCIDNVCVKKHGCAYDNPACVEGKICDVSKIKSGQCVSVGGAASTTPDTSATTDTGTGASLPSLKLCGIGLVFPALFGFGYLYSRSRKR